MANRYLDSHAKAEEESGLLEKTGDFFQYGIADSVISAGVSFYNTGVALGNAFGAEGEFAETEEWIEDSLGYEAANYYAQNEDVINIGGLVIGSLLPGLGAIKAGRAIASGVLSTKTGSFATGIQNTLFSERRIAALQKGIVHNNEQFVFKAVRNKLAAQNAGQAFTESVLFEAATLLTLNQNPVMSRGEYDYFESITHNLDLAAYGVVFGTVLGGGIGHLVDGARIKAFNRDNEQGIAEVRRIFNSGVNSIVGDEVAMRLQDVKQLEGRIEQIKGLPTDEAATLNRELTWAENTLKDASDDIVGMLNAASTSKGLGTKVVEAMQANQNTTSQMLDVFAGLGKISALKDVRPRKGMTSAVADEADLELPSLFTKRYGEEFLVDEVKAVGRMKSDLMSGKLGTEDTATLFREAAGLLEADDIALLWRENMRVKVTLKNEKGSPIKLDDLSADDLLSFNLPKSRKGSKKQVNLAVMLDVRDALREFAYDFDPMYKRVMDNYRATVKEGDVERLGELIENVLRIDHPTQLFASTYRVINRGDLDETLLAELTKAKGRYRPLYEWLNNNKGLQTRYGQRDAFIDLRTGRISTTTPAARMSDLGEITFSGKGQTVNAGSESFRVKAEPGVDMTVAKASARFAWAHSTTRGAGISMFNKGAIRKGWEESLHTNDLAIMQAVLQHYDFSKGALKFAQEGTDQTIEVATIQQLTEMVVKGKRDLVLQFSAEGKQEGRFLSEVAAYADVDEAYVNAVQARTRGLDTPRDAGSEFYTNDVLRQVSDEGFESFNPTFVKASYDVSTFSKLGDRESSMYEVSRRVQVVQDNAEIIANKILGEFASDFPMPGVGRNGAATIIDDVTSGDETTSFVRTFNPDFYTGQSMIQEIGQQLQRIMQKDSVAIFAELDEVAKKVNLNEGAVAELSILQQSTLRSGKYRILEDTTLGMDTASAEVYRLIGIDIFAEMDTKVFKANGLSRTGDHIIEEETLQFAQARMAKLNLTQDQIAEFTALALNKSAGNTDAAAAVLQIQQGLRPTLDDTFIDIGTKFTQESSATASKTVHKVHNPEVMDFLKAHRETNRKYLVNAYNDLHQAWGKPSGIDAEVLYPGRFDASRFKHIAFVKMSREAKDPWAMKGQGVIIARSADELNRKIAHFKSKYHPDDIIIESNEQIIKSKKVRTEYDAELAVTDTAIDIELRKDGKLWDVAPELNTDVVSEMVEGIANQRKNVLRQTIKLKYGQEIATLEQMDRTVSLHGTISPSGKRVGEQTAFQKNINQMLALTDRDTHGFWHTAQEKADLALSAAGFALKGAWRQALSKDDWEGFSKLMDDYGMPKVYGEADDWILSNAKAPKPKLQRAVSQANGIFATLMLRLDQAHAAVTAMSTPIMLVPELRELAHATKSLTPEQLKRFNLATTVPLNAAGDTMPSNMKIMMQAVNNLFQKDKAYIQEYIDRGIIGSEVQQLRTVVDAVSYSPSKNWVNNVRDTANFLATPVDWTERSVKFWAADSARQMLDLAGIPANHPMYWSTIRTFTNRVHGNYSAAQRPTLFQGWAGQAVGLFQTYQFNLFQQFMKHVENGRGNAKYLVGIQAATFGGQSLPGFQLANRWIGERTAGEKDFYSATTETFDSPVAEFLIYGGASSLTRPLLNGKGIDFFARGNLTPRTPILIPTSFEEIPAISFLSKIYTGFASTLSQISQGADVSTTVFNAIANNGINRPIGGAAQLWQQQKTTLQGGTLFNYTDIDYATTITKLMGTRTLDEAIAVGAFYRAQGYKTHRMEQLNELGRVVKSKVRSAEGIGSADLSSLMKEYTGRGGNARTFNRWMQNNFTNANEGSVVKMRNTLTSPEGQYMQRVMGSQTNEFLDSTFRFQ